VEDCPRIADAGDNINEATWQKGMAMATTAGIFEVGLVGNTLVVTPTANIGELAFRDIETGAKAVLDCLSESAVRSVVLDLGRTDYFGTTAVGFFLRLWKRVRDRNGRMVLCNVSGHEKELLKLTKLDGLWGVADSREQALRLAAG
jgi:anti-anti-sigma factor